MPIEEYHFGSITIDGKTYNYDVEARWDSQVLAWQRKNSHIIDKEDVERALEQKPELIVIGTGESGVAEMTEVAQNGVKSAGIKLIVEATGQAIETFNFQLKKSLNQNGQRKIIGLFHLTC